MPADETMDVRLVQTGEPATVPAWHGRRLVECGQATATAGAPAAPVNRAELTGGRPPLALPEG